MKKFVLHTGIAKTATSTLQQTVFTSHSEIYYLGKLVKSESPRGCRSQEVYDLLEPVLWRRKKIRDWQQQLERFQALVVDQAGADQVVVASWEALGGIKKTKFRALVEDLRRMCPSAQVLVCMRNPLTWVSSQYLQNVQGHFLKNNRGKIFRGRPWLSFEEWAESKRSNRDGIGGWLSHGANARMAVEILGRENVGVFLFEELSQDPGAYYAALAGFLDIDAQESVRLAEGAHKNPRVSVAELEYIKGQDSNPVRRFLWRRQNQHVRNLALQKAILMNGDTTGARVELPEHWFEPIASATRETNMWLKEELGLPVEKFGYPL